MLLELRGGCLFVVPRPLEGRLERGSWFLPDMMLLLGRSPPAEYAVERARNIEHLHGGSSNTTQCSSEEN